jgi:hypothetical protein
MEKHRLQQLIYLAKNALRQGDRRTAGEVSRLILDQHPNCLDALLILGGISKPEKRKYYLNKANKIAPKDPRVLEALAWANSQEVEGDHQYSPKQASAPGIQTQSVVGRISDLHIEENHRLVWIWAIIFLLVISIVFLGLGAIPNVVEITEAHAGLLQSTNILKPTLTQTPAQNTPMAGIAQTEVPTNTATASPTPTPSPTPTVVPNLYGCNMEIRFTSGPLEGEGTAFSMLDETYFFDKGDKFDTGKNTGIFYDEQRYVILHSGYNKGNILSPLEIEFLRKYLELWGAEDPEYIRNQIDNIIGSRIVWLCNGQQVMETKVKDVARLSHDASTRLWLEPQNIFEIINTRASDPSEWIGEIDQIIPKSLHLAFCGWGPPGIKEDRSTYYRYIFQFEILD